MTVSTTNAQSGPYAGNGVQVNFPFDFKILASTDVEVILADAAGVETVLTLTTHYSVSAGPWPAGGSVTLLTAPLSTETLTIRRDMALTQALDYITGGKFPAESHEEGLDRVVMLAQQVIRDQSQSLRFPKSEGVSEAYATLPAKASRASRYQGYDADGKPIATAGTTDATPISSFMATVVDDANAGAAVETLRGSLAAETVPMELTDELIFRDASASAGKRITLEQFYRMPFWLSGAYSDIEPTNDEMAFVRTGTTVYGATVQDLRGRLRNAVTASGTAIDFTGIPSGVRRVCVMYAGLSTNGAGGGNSSVILQIGDSSGIQTGTYLGSHISFPGPSIVPHLTGCYLMNGVVAARVMHGMIELRLLDATTRTWVFATHTSSSDADIVEQGTASKALASGELNRLRITTVGGTDTFDAGSVSILYD